MAKFVFYLAAKQQSVHSATQAAIAFAKSTFASKQLLQCAVMHPRASDVLAIPRESGFLKNVQVVLEVHAPMGSPMQPWLGGLERELAGLLQHVAPALSHVFAVTPRVLQNNGTKRQRYHYLMFRADHYSPSDYLDYYMNSHYRFGIKTPLANYVQNYADPNTTAALAAALGMQIITADNFSELHFDDVNEYLSSDAIAQAGPAAIRDEALFVNRDRCQSFSMNVVYQTSQAGPQSNA